MFSTTYKPSQIRFGPNWSQFRLAGIRLCSPDSYPFLLA
jgi:hypothetical protein